MSFDGLCLKISFWPFLTYLASLKGLCPFYPPSNTPSTTTTLPTTIPTFQPTPPTSQAPCPADPLACLSGGVRPIPYCPCIDPRQQNGETTTMATADSAQNLRLRLNLPYATAVVGTEMLVFSHLENLQSKRKRKKRKIVEGNN